VTFYRYAVQGVVPIGEAMVITGGIEQGLVSDAGEIATSIATAWSTAWSAVAGEFCTGTRWNKVSVYELDTISQPAVDVAEASLNLVGTNSTDPLPPQVAVCVTLQTGRPGRSYRGRHYLGGLPENKCEPPGKLVATSRTAIANFYSAWMGSVNSAIDSRLCVVLSPTLNIGTPITAVSVGDIYDTQRSRRDSQVEVYTTATVSQI
jgi:hypothetical protein